jgi:hypothetical protein
MERVHVELPGVLEGLTVYVTAYFPQADKGGKRGKLKLAVEAFGGGQAALRLDAQGHHQPAGRERGHQGARDGVQLYPNLKLRKTIAKIGGGRVCEGNGAAVLDGGRGNLQL